MGSALRSIARGTTWRDGRRRHLRPGLCLSAVISTDGITTNYCPFGHAYVGRVGTASLTTLLSKAPGTIECEYEDNQPQCRDLAVTALDTP
jgi:hypothetical protein